jgi:hypothetical protein
MLKIIRNWQLRDYLRSMQGARGYGIPIAKNYMALQWYGAYADTNGVIEYFIARQVDNYSELIASYAIEESRIKVENGQYVYDNTQLFDGYLPDGTYYFEFNDGYETYYSELFTVKDTETLMFASGGWPVSSSEYISSSSIENPLTEVLKQLESGEYVEFEIN